MATPATQDELELKQFSTGIPLADNARPTEEEKAATTAAPEAEVNGLKELTPIGTRVVANGEVFYIQGWQIGDVLAISTDIANFVVQFSQVEKDDFPLIIALIASQLPTVVSVIGVTIKRDLEFCKKIKLEEMVDIIPAIMEENPRFFRKLEELWKRTQPIPTTQPDQPTTEEAQSESETEKAQGNEPPLIGSI